MTPDNGGGGEKTEKATPKKREDARKKGQVLRSAEVNTAVLTASMFAAIFLFGGWMATSMGELIVHSVDLMSSGPTEITVHVLFTQITQAVWQMLLVLAPLLGVALFMGIAVNVAQVGFLLVGAPLKPKLSKINPLSGFKRIFSVRSLVEMVKAILKITAVGIVVYLEYMANMPKFASMLNLTVAQSARAIVDMAMGVAFKAALVLAAIGAADFFYQWWDYEKNLRMSKEEVKQEFKQTEGDPQIKSKRREKQRQMSMMRMMQDIPKADVVITNPTHYAIAIRYDDSESDAPIVIAKGKDAVALKIREKAREARVEIVENKPVAQALFVSCEVGQRIPPDLFAAVAEILAYVYKRKNPVRPGAAKAPAR